MLLSPTKVPLFRDENRASNIVKSVLPSRETGVVGVGEGGGQSDVRRRCGCGGEEGKCEETMKCGHSMKSSRLSEIDPIIMLVRKKVSPKKKKIGGCGETERPLRGRSGRMTNDDKEESG